MSKYGLEFYEDAEDRWVRLKRYQDLSLNKAKFLVRLCDTAAKTLKRNTRIRMCEVSDD